MTLHYDMYAELDFLGSIGIDNDQLVIEGPEKDAIRSMIEEFFAGKQAKQILDGLPERFHGVIHVRPHGAPKVVHPD